MNTDDVKAFEDTFSKVLNTYSIQNPKYGDCWKNDNLGIRGIYAEISAKIHRLHNMIWEFNGFDKLTDISHRSHVREVICDTILYLAMLDRRMVLDHGPVSDDEVDRLRDKT